MTGNDVRKFRNSLGLNQTKFGLMIGWSKYQIILMEKREHLTDYQKHMMFYIKLMYVSKDRKHIDSQDIETFSNWIWKEHNKIVARN